MLQRKINQNTTVYSRNKRPAFLVADLVISILHGTTTRVTKSKRAIDRAMARACNIQMALWGGPDRPRLSPTHHRAYLRDLDRLKIVIQNMFDDLDTGTNTAPAWLLTGILMGIVNDFFERSLPPQPDQIREWKYLLGSIETLYRHVEENENPDADTDHAQSQKQAYYIEKFNEAIYEH